MKLTQAANAAIAESLDTKSPLIKAPLAFENIFLVIEL